MCVWCVCVYICRCLRAFRALLFTEDTALAGAACLQDMPPGLVLLHAFSRWVCRGVVRGKERVKEGSTAQQFAQERETVCVCGGGRLVEVAWGADAH